MIAHELTQEQYNALQGHEWNEGDLFNPTTDANGIMFISVQEVNGYEGTEFPWVASLPQVEIQPVIRPIE